MVLAAPGPLLNSMICPPLGEVPGGGGFPHHLPTLVSDTTRCQASPWSPCLRRGSGKVGKTSLTDETHGRAKQSGASLDCRISNSSSSSSSGHRCTTRRQRALGSSTRCPSSSAPITVRAFLSMTWILGACSRSNRSSNSSSSSRSSSSSSSNNSSSRIGVG